MENETKIGRPTLVVAAVVAAVVAGLMFVISAPEQPSAQPPPTEPSEPVNSTVTLGVWGTDAEIAAYQKVVDDYNESTEVVAATLASWSDADAMLAAIESGAADPDVYMVPREDLGPIVAEGRNRPLLDLLDARGVSTGDDYFRTSIEAFSAEDALQCMPWTSSPMVIYYNTDLIDFEQLAEQDLPVPREEDGRWSLEAFEAAAQMATRPRGGTRGFAIDPTLEGLAPFLLSGGGKLFDDADAPTSLALSDDASVDAITETLTVLRESQYTLTEEQLERRTPVEWFERGRVGMIAGYRDLVPRLRKAKDLNFDVLPMPRLDEHLTTGRMTGLCVSEGAQAEVDRAADFLVHIISTEEVADIAAATGSLAPTNQQVAFSPEYLQPDLEPARSAVFTAEQRYIALPPLLDSWDELEQLASDELAMLMTTPVLDPDGEIEEVLTALDEESRSLLDPDYEEESEEAEESDEASSDSRDEGSSDSRGDS